MIALAVIGSVFAVLIAWALAAMASENENHSEKLLQRFERDKELQDAYWLFTFENGRPPSTRELWDYCPPADNEE